VAVLLVTGGAGFIGSNYVRWVLATSDDRVRIYDALTYAGNPVTVAELQALGGDRVEFVHADICDPAAAAAAMDGVDVVVHFAAESHVDRSISGPGQFVVTNCVGTNVICSAALEVGVDKVVHISTDEVYGSVEVGHSSETDVLDPRSPYSASKAGSDLIARSYFSTFGLPVVTTRSSNNFGPYQYPEKMIPLFVTNLLDGQRVPLYGDGGNRRDWLHVQDNCAALDRVVRSGAPGQIYNVGGGTELTNRELTERILALAGAGPDMIEPVADRLGHDRRYAVDVTKITALGWAPAIGIDEGLEATFAWYVDHRAWWEPLKARRAVAS
jgi:dTDP-glucose 4,6-dehydratase